MTIITDDELLAVLAECNNNQREAARKTGISRSTIQYRLKKLALRGHSPAHDMTHTVPDGFVVKGVSTYYNKDGVPSGQWVKSSADAERREAIYREVLERLSAEIPREKPTRAPKQAPDGLLNCYVVTDYHMGMLAWGEETGADWDTQIAEDVLVQWFKQALAEAPDSEVGVWAQLGDFLHWDGWDAVTPAHKHLLDADTRFPKLVGVAYQAVRRIIRLLLQKHNKVHIIMAEGNHDPASSVHLRQYIAALFEDEPRLTVDLNPDPYYCYEWGSTSLFFHHGHKKRLHEIDRTFAAKFREVFGRTTQAFAHMGHLHHAETKESSLMIVEQHQTLAAPDAYASRGGWLSGRSAQVITYDKVYGDRGRRRIPASLILDQLAAA